MAHKPNLLGFNDSAVAGIMDYYEVTMADTNIVAGIAGRKSVFNAAVRKLSNHKIIHEDAYTSDGTFAIMSGKVVKFDKYYEEADGKTYHSSEVEEDNYLLNTGLEQILAFLSGWKIDSNLIQAFSKRGLSHETIKFLESAKTLDLTIEAIPEGTPIFANEPYLSVEGTFELCQFPESLILGTWGYQTAVATQASYIINILKEFEAEGILTLEGGSRRTYPGCSLAATRAALAAGFKGTSLVEIVRQYPELLYKMGGSSGHSAILHIGSDEEAFELQLRAYYGIKPGDSSAVIEEKIKNTKGIGPTFLIDTFDSNEGLKAAIKLMKKYGIQSQIRNDSSNNFERVRDITNALNEESLGKVKIMISDDLKPWRIYELLKNGANFDALLIGTYLVNPYKLPGAAYKLAADEYEGKLVPKCKISKNDPAKSTLPGKLDVYRIIGKDGKADRDVILLRGIDAIDDHITRNDCGYIKLNRQVMKSGELCYDIPDMCQLIEDTRHHLGLLRPEHKLFRNAAAYPVIVSETILKIRQDLLKSW